MKQGELYEKGRHELEGRIEDLEQENAALGEEVSQWMADYDILKNAYEEYGLALTRKAQEQAADTRLLMDILKELESGDYDVESICSWIRDALQR